MQNWKSLKQELLKNPAVAREYLTLAPRYQLISQVIAKRLEQGLTQAELARKIGTKQSAIARLESGDANPSVAFLEKLAAGLGAKLKIALT